MASPSIEANRIWPSAPHVPVMPAPGRTSQIGIGAPDPSSSRFSLLSVKKAIAFPSGDQNADCASSVPSSGFASREASPRR